jgi:hypothetical protein
MLAVTKAALERLSRKLAGKGAADGMALRFKPRARGWMLHLDHESVGDTTFAHKGRKVLLLDETVSKGMANMTLDTRQTGERSRLRLYRSKTHGD